MTDKEVKIRSNAPVCSLRRGVEDTPLATARIGTERKMAICSGNAEDYVSDIKHTMLYALSGSVEDSGL